MGWVKVYSIMYQVKLALVSAPKVHIVSGYEAHQVGTGYTPP